MLIVGNLLIAYDDTFLNLCFVNVVIQLLIIVNKL